MLVSTAVQTPLADRVISLTHFSAQLSLAMKVMSASPTLKQCGFYQEVFRLEMWHWRLRMLNISRRWLPHVPASAQQTLNSELSRQSIERFTAKIAANGGCRQEASRAR